ncbi:phasin family protein [Acinetobacter sp.]|uniref:phasin family protein n=1 Tax=Acinetobacter sp. TaxID=472 RepID=UPI00388D6985
MTGLGAFSHLEKESYKLFESLVKIGETLESTTHHKIDEEEKASRNRPELKEKG